MTNDEMIQVGQRVKILIDTPEGEPAEGVIRVLQSEPGKLVGVELDNYAKGGHTLDSVLNDEKVDPTTRVRYGRGWWTRPENLEFL